MFKFLFILLFLKLIRCKSGTDYFKENEIFDCNCIADFNQVSQQCPNGLTQLNCKIDNNNLTHLLVQLDESCYSGLNLENVNQIPTHAFQTLNLIHSATLSFKNVHSISSFAFEFIKNSIKIKIDSNFLFNTRFESKCFASIQNLTLIEFKQFKLLELNNDLFQESIIDTILVNRSKFYGFIKNHDKTTTFVNNLVITDSYTNGILDDELLGYFYSLERVTIKNSGIEIVLDIFEKYAQLKHLDLGLNSIRTIDFNNKLIELNLYNNPVKKFHFTGDKLKYLNLKSTLIENFSIRAPNLEHIALANSKFITKFKNLNSFLNKIEENVIDNLKIIDVSHDEISLEEEIFFDDYLKKKNCLWNQILNRTFIKINRNHRCDCSTIYLYKNFNLTLEEIRLVPICYAKLLIESKVNEYEKKCAFQNVYTNCSFLSVSTVLPLTFKTSNSELFTRKKIVWEFTVPIIITIFVTSLFILVLFILKAKREFSKKFHIFKKNDTNQSLSDQNEMSQILTISSSSISIRLNETS